MVPLMWHNYGYYYSAQKIYSHYQDWLLPYKVTVLCIREIRKLINLNKGNYVNFRCIWPYNQSLGLLITTDPDTLDYGSVILIDNLWPLSGSRHKVIQAYWVKTRHFFVSYLQRANLPPKPDLFFNDDRDKLIPVLKKEATQVYYRLVLITSIHTPYT